VKRRRTATSVKRCAVGEKTANGRKNKKSTTVNDDDGERRR